MRWLIASRSGTAAMIIAAKCMLHVATAAAPSTAPEVITKELRIASLGISLAGTLSLPASDTPFAAIVLVAGSGEEQRMTSLAHDFAREGIAVLTYDKRGVGKSGGEYAEPEFGAINLQRENLLILADDAYAALKALEREPRLRDVPLGFLGLSQAGWVVPIAAAKIRSARFIVLWSGPVASVHETLHFSRYVEEHGIPPTLERLSSGELVSMPRPQPGDFGFRDTDPRFHLSRLSVPGLWLFGERDTSIPVELSTERLAGMRASGQKLLEYQVIPGSGHRFGKEALEETVRWLRKVLFAHPCGDELDAFTPIQRSRVRRQCAA